MVLTEQERQAIIDNVAAVMPEKMTGGVMGLENVEHPEHGVITVDMDLLRLQINWLAGLPSCEESEGILGLLEGIQDLVDPPKDLEVDG